MTQIVLCGLPALSQPLVLYIWQRFSRDTYIMLGLSAVAKFPVWSYHSPTTVCVCVCECECMMMMMMKH